jgi:cyclase
MSSPKNLKRIIARLDVKGNRLIKGIHLEGWRFLPGNPLDYCQKYYDQGADEIIYIDSVASLYSRNYLSDLIEQYTKGVFIPITVGGGIRTVENAFEILRSGADKIAINTQAVKEPEIISRIADRFGIQCVVASIQAKFNNTIRQHEVWYDSAREKTDLEVVEWALKLESLGAGEILLTSVDKDGLMRGMDVELISKVASAVKIPVIASGGFSKVQDLDGVVSSNADAVAIAKALHYENTSITDVKMYAKSNNIFVRP